MLSQLEKFYIAEDWKDPKSQFLLTLKFWTRLPLPIKPDAYPFSLDMVARMTLPVALVVGGLLSLIIAFLALLHVPEGVSAALVIVGGLVITGALHEDGLANCADSIGGKSSAQRLEIMKDNRLGTFGVLAVAVSLLIRWQALSDVYDESAGLAIGAVIAAAVLSRVAALVPFGVLQPANSDGSDVSAGMISTPYFYGMLFGGFVLAGVFLAPALHIQGFILMSGAIAGILWLAIHWAQRNFGGSVGDMGGAVQQIVETVVLVSVVMFGL